MIKIKRLVLECECGDQWDCKDESQLVDIEKAIAAFERRHGKCGQQKLFGARKEDTE